MAISPLELRLLKGWLSVITLFEVPNIYGYLVTNAPLSGSFSTLRNARPEKRVWCIVLSLLMLARMQAIVYTRSPGVLANNAAVHILEALTFGYEKYAKGSNGGGAIYSLIVANAVWFLSAAMRN